MTQKLWLWVGAIAIVLVGGLLGYRVLYPKTASESSTTTEPSSPTSSTSSTCLPKADLATTVTLEYRDRQFFAPEASEATTTVCIPLGGTVTWVNKSSGEMQIASDPHPTHFDLVGFDSLSSKTTYSFTFTKAGTWGYHNHADSEATGTVIVVD
jgi:plastocyanin